jgi:hypothetical protein
MVTIIDNNDNISFVECYKTGNFDLVKKQLLSNIDIHKCQEHPFIFSCLNGNYEIAKIIYKYDNKIKIIHDDDSINTMQFIINNKYLNIKYKHKKNKTRHLIDFKSLFEIVVDKGYLNIAKLLLDESIYTHDSNCLNFDKIITITYIQNNYQFLMDVYNYHITNKINMNKFKQSTMYLIERCIVDKKYEFLLYILKFITDNNEKVCCNFYKIQTNQLKEIGEYISNCDDIKYYYTLLWHYVYNIKYTNEFMNYLVSLKGGCNTLKEIGIYLVNMTRYRQINIDEYYNIGEYISALIYS